jgi:tellurite methyltransferase
VTAADRTRWDKRYRGETYDHPLPPRKFLVDNLQWMPNSGIALDIASGTGRNAGCLLQRGLRVIAVDVSPQALLRAHKFNAGIQAVAGDLTNFHLPENEFDIILNFYYLQRDLWPRFAQILKPGGILVLETMTEKMHAIHPEISAAHLLKNGELLKAFSDWEVLVYRDGWFMSDRGGQKAVASMVARKPTDIKINSEVRNGRNNRTRNQPAA